MFLFMPGSSYAKIEPPFRDMVHRDGLSGQNGGMTIRIARHQMSQTHPLCLCGKCCEQGPAFKTGAIWIPSQRHKVVEEPHMVNQGFTVCL